MPVLDLGQRGAKKFLNLTLGIREIARGSFASLGVRLVYF